MSRNGWFCMLVLCLLMVMPVGASDTPDEEVIAIRTPETRIVIVAVSPRLINDGLVDTTVARQSSSGLRVMGVGEQVYVAASEGDLEATGFVWSITAPTGSAVIDLADATGVGKTFTPDVEGDYEVTLVLSHADGDTTLTQTFLASRYVGYERCEVCHANMPYTGFVDGWKETGHAKKFTRGITGVLSGGYGVGCIKCHTVGYNTSNIVVDPADNGGFADVARDLGWTFPENLLNGTWQQVPDGETAQIPTDETVYGIGTGGWKLDLVNHNFDDLPEELKAVANIQCESCHGPGDAHASSGDVTKIGKSMRVGVCARCHDDGHYHVRPEEWESSGHGKTWNRDSNTCAPCHLGSGRIAAIDQGLSLEDIMAEEKPESGSFELGVTQTCATCHNPHSVANDHQVRWKGSVTLEVMAPGTADPVSVTTGDMGLAAACGQCHHLRPGRNVLGESMHHSHQTDMIQAVGGYEYADVEFESGGHRNMENVCINCHMAIPPSGSEERGVLGSHTWRMHDDETDLHNTSGCARCHGPLEDFNVNGARDEISRTLAILADLLPKTVRDPNTVATYFQEGSTRGSAEPLTDQQMQAAWNHNFVEFDGSGGVHNFRYSKSLLAASLRDIQGDGPAPELAGDFDGDGSVGFDDMFLFLPQFGTSSASDNWDTRFDLSGNGVVGFADWLAFLDTFGNSSTSTKPVTVDNGRNTQALLSLVGSDRPSIDNQHLAIAVRADGLTDMKGYTATVTYDPEQLRFVRVLRSNETSLSEAGEAPGLAILSQAPGQLVISDGTADGSVAGSTLLADLVFELLAPVNETAAQISFAQIFDSNLGVNGATGLADRVSSQTASYALGQNFPNPFNPETTIKYSLAEAGQVRIVVYNTLGQEIRTIVDNHKLSGDYSVRWDGRDSAGNEVASGLYLYRMEANGFTDTQRMTLLK